MQIQIVHYLFNVHHLRLIDFCDTDVMFGSDGESSLKEKAEIVSRIATLMPLSSVKALRWTLTALTLQGLSISRESSLEQSLGV